MEIRGWWSVKNQLTVVHGKVTTCEKVFTQICKYDHTSILDRLNQKLKKSINNTKSERIRETLYNNI